MVKRGGALLLLTLILMTSLVFAANGTIDSDKINDAYECLQDKADANCDSFSTEEKIFTLLAIDECQSELIEDSLNEECWPKGSCKIKTTAQAILALDNTNANIDDAQIWLISQNRTSSDIEWYLEIDSPDITSCEISYSNLNYNLDILEDKTLTNNAGSCLILAQNNYWLRISPSCYDREFEISCDKSFLTTLLFKKTDADTIHVLDKTSSASAEGTTLEKVNSFCFGLTSCDYEGTLWASIVLDSLDYDVSAFLPYLIVMSEDYKRLLPDAFLYSLTDNLDYRTSILSMQKSNKYWQESGDRFYDTALALFPFQHETSNEKENAKSWLLTIQDSEGCWEGNVRNTAFVLASLWPKEFIGGDGEIEIPDCEDAGYYCMSGANCLDSGGQLYGDYECSGLSKCCSVPQDTETCAEAGGEICSSNEVCKSGTLVSTDDLGSGEKCCVQGSCEARSSSTQCELDGGICRFTCGAGEEEISSSCGGSGICCISKTSSGNYLWIWILLCLIVLVGIGIFFKDKLRAFWFKLKSKFGKGNGSPQFPHHLRPSGPGPFSGHSSRLISRIPERRILLPLEQAKLKPHPALKRPLGKSQTQKELDNVLKKLKEMSE